MEYGGEMKTKAILCDIDMTTVDSSKAMDACVLISNCEERWNCFYGHLDLQETMQWCVDILKNSGLPVVFVTGRCVTYADKTIPILDTFGIDYKLIMREEGDFRPDYVVKNEVLEKLLKTYDFVFAIDDRESNCQVFFEHGIPTLQVYYPEELRLKG